MPEGVMLIDRYAVVNHVQRAESGLKRLLSECDKVLPGIAVTLLTAYDDDCNSEAVIKAARHLASQLTLGGITQIHLYAGDQRLFATDTHYRYVRFDATVCELDVGIGILAGERTYARSNYRLRARTEGDVTEETRLRTKLHHNTFMCANT